MTIDRSAADSIFDNCVYEVTLYIKLEAFQASDGVDIYVWC